MQEKIIIKGARENNLKNIDLELPRDKFIVFTGLSGSGKSTLAFDTIFAEGQRRYLESLSSYARQFLGQMEKPNVDYIEGLSPAISIDQKSTSHNPRSTVGTVTEIHDYLRLLYAKIGRPHCLTCKREITKLSTEEIVDKILDMPEDIYSQEVRPSEGQTSNFRIQILSPVVRSRKGEYLALLDEMYKLGYSKAYINDKLYKLRDWKKIKLARYKKHNIDIVIDELEINDENISRIFEDVEKALKLSGGIVRIKSKDQISNSRKGTLSPPKRCEAPSVLFARDFTSKSNPKTKVNNDIIFNQNLACPEHDISFPELEPRFFSFNAPQGACEECEGLGTKKEVDPERVIPDKNLTIAEGGVLTWSYKKNNYQGTILRSVCNYYHIPDNNRLRDLPEEKLNILLYGNSHGLSKDEEEEYDLIPIRYRFKSSGGSYNFNLLWKGVVGWLLDRYQKTSSDAVRSDIEKYMSQKKCSICRGSRYKKEVLLVTVGGKNIDEINTLSVRDSLEFFRGLLREEIGSPIGDPISEVSKQKVIKGEEVRPSEGRTSGSNNNINIQTLSSRELKIAGRIIKEIINRLEFLNNVGLEYLTLSRAAHTLSGGEAQRIRLASQIGSQLVGVLYILDEPSIGLHARDNQKLLGTLRKLQKLGNTLIVIEHDEETMRGADWIVDIGPAAGKHGGKIVAAGSVKEVMNSKDSVTAKYLRHEESIPTPPFRRPIKKKKRLMIRGACEHNLKNVTVEFPLGVFTCVTGVSGSGKSTLVEETLYKSLARKIHRALMVPGRHKEIIGETAVRKVVMVDQSPIGKTPRSNPATYTGLFTPIRQLFSVTKEAQVKGYSPSRFSFNVRGGRCDNCDGAGFLKIEMQFMPDVYLPCDVCRGKRYNSETLKVKYKNKNIADVLEMTVSEARIFFKNFPKIENILRVLEEVGLGYIELGQNATTFSGGEAQRIKLATELARLQLTQYGGQARFSQRGAMYILDEPTTGLHFEDIKKLLNVLNKLVDAGNSVVVIEHNLDIIKNADWIIDLGPEGGEKGGKVIVTGTPEEVAKYDKESFTGKYLTKVL